MSFIGICHLNHFHLSSPGNYSCIYQQYILSSTSRVIEMSKNHFGRFYLNAEIWKKWKLQTFLRSFIATRLAKCTHHTHDISETLIIFPDPKFKSLRRLSQNPLGNVTFLQAFKSHISAPGVKIYFTPTKGDFCHFCNFTLTWLPFNSTTFKNDFKK